ncbi:MAG: hypothetical protein ACK4NW_12185 [Roseinatronobacter sp.]
MKLLPTVLDLMAHIGDAPLSSYVFIERESDLGTTRFLLVESDEADVYCPDTRDYRVEFQNTVWVDFLEVALVQDIRQGVTLARGATASAADYVAALKYYDENDAFLDFR